MKPEALMTEWADIAVAAVLLVSLPAPPTPPASSGRCMSPARCPASCYCGSPNDIIILVCFCRCSPASWPSLSPAFVVVWFVDTKDKLFKYLVMFMQKWSEFAYLALISVE